MPFTVFFTKTLTAVSEPVKTTDAAESSPLSTIFTEDDDFDSYLVLFDLFSDLTSDFTLSVEFCSFFESDLLLPEKSGSGFSVFTLSEPGLVAGLAGF